jgi:hypothetical protein
VRPLARRLACERGQALIEGLLALGLVLLAVAFGVQALAYVHARSVAIAAAQDGVRAAAAGGPQAGLDRAAGVLAAAGGTGADLRPAVSEQRNEVTVRVTGQAPRLFSLPLLLPPVSVSASLPLEQYPEAEQAAAP